MSAHPNQRTERLKSAARSSFSTEDGNDLTSVTSETFNDEIFVSESDRNCMGGYLLKKSSEGEWQKRYFETNQSFLTYYKSRKMTKLLAALNTAELGDVILIGKMSDKLGEGVVFQLELKSKSILLRTQSMNQAVRWIEKLKQMRDAAKSQVIAEAPETTTSKTSNSAPAKSTTVHSTVSSPLSTTNTPAATPKSNETSTTQTTSAAAKEKPGQCCIIL